MFERYEIIDLKNRSAFPKHSLILLMLKKVKIPSVLKNRTGKQFKLLSVKK